MKRQRSEESKAVLNISFDSSNLPMSLEECVRTFKYSFEGSFEFPDVMGLSFNLLVRRI